MVEHGFLDTLEGGVWLLTPIAQVSVIAVLVRYRLLRTFKVFGLYLAADVLRSSFMWWFGRSAETKQYWVLWLITEPVFLLFQCFLVLELYRLLYAAYPGIRGFARMLVGLGVVVALIVTFGSINVDVGRIVWRVPNVQGMFITKRVVSSLLGMLVLVTMMFFPRAPSARKILLHGWLLAGMFLVAAIGFFAINFGYRAELMGVAFLLVQIVLLALWAFGFSRPIPRRDDPPTPEEIQQVERWNDDLLRVARWLVS